MAPIQLITRDGEYKFNLRYECGVCNDEIEKKFLGLCTQVKPPDTRYNCFGHCFASGLGWIADDKIGKAEIRVLLNGESDMNWDTEFDARKIIKGNGLTRVLFWDKASNRPPQLCDEIRPGDYILYCRSPLVPPEHVGQLVNRLSIGERGEMQNEILNWLVRSKISSGSEFLHSPLFGPLGDQNEYIEVWGDRNGFR